MALGGSNKTLTITTRFDADASSYFREVERVNAKTKEAAAASQGFAKVLGEIKIERVKMAFTALGAELGGTAQAMATAAQHGFDMGAVFGPLGAAIGGAAGALVGLIRETDKQSAASLRAAEAAKKHAAALQLVAEGETKARGQRRSLREREEIAQEELNQARLTATRLGYGQDTADVQRAVRELREIEAEKEAMNRSDGVIFLEQRKRDLERLNALKDIAAAQRSRIIDDIEAARRRKELAKADADALDIVDKYKEKQKETAEAVQLLNRRLQAGQIDAKAYEELLRSVDEDYRARDDERKRREEQAIARTKQLAEERRKLANEEAKRLTDELVKQLEGESGGVTGSLGVNDYTAGINTQELLQRQLENNRAQIIANDQLLIQRQAMADAIQREIDLQREYTDLVGQAYGVLIDGSSGAVESLKNLAKQQLVALGVREAVEAASQFAYGLGALANPLFAGAAAMHFASAAKHAAAAGLAGVGVAAIGAIGGGGSSSSGGGLSGGSASSGGTTGGSAEPQGTTINYYIVGDSYAEDSPRMRQRNAERIVEVGTQRTSAGRAE